jgi:hypothetical protein
MPAGIEGDAEGDLVIMVSPSLLPSSSDEAFRFFPLINVFGGVSVGYTVSNLSLSCCLSKGSVRDLDGDIRRDIR